MSMGLRAGTPDVLSAAHANGDFTCEECGYDLRGAEPGRPCPECGRAPNRAGVRVRQGTVWTISVTAGLALLLLLTIDGVSSVLVQPFEEFTWGGTLPALNLPGPKLWAVPLLQRPIGNSPELPGVIGTRTAMLSLLAVWLITTRRPRQDYGAEEPSDSHTSPTSSGELLRLATRWVTVVVFGANFGVLVAQHGFWPQELPPYRVLLVCTAELPATLLLYLYLDRLAADFPGRAYRVAFDRLLWAVPAVIAAGAIMLVLSWLSPEDRDLTESGVNLPVAAVYGTISLCVGVAASAAVTWLTGVFALRAFPGWWRGVLGTRRWLQTLATRGESLPLQYAARSRAYAIAVGLVLLPGLMVFGVEHVGWYTGRAGLMGNLPFYNFPGPKLWAAAAVPELSGRSWWDPILSRTTLTVLNLVAFWLITIKPVGVGGDTKEPIVAKFLRLTVRWLPAIAVGASLGFASVVGFVDEYGDTPLTGTLRSEFFAAVTVFCEVPATVLLYLYLGVLAVRCGRPKMRAALWVLAVAIVVLTAAGLSGLALSRSVDRSSYQDPPVLIAGAVYGAMTLVTTAWAVVTILTLAWVVARATGGVVARVTMKAHEPS